MTRKYIFISIGSLVVIILASGGIYYRYQSLRAQKATAQKPQQSDGGTLSATNELPPSQQQDQQVKDGGLNVNPPSANSGLGQLLPNQDNTPAPNKQPSSPFDPSTFSQYDKYKDEKNALYGETKAGTGTELTAGMQAAVLYKGWLTNGTIFDMSKSNDKGELQPYVFTLGQHQVIPGWEQSLAGMKVGGVRLLIIPPAVGYGSQGKDSIPPNSVLIFQVQLLEAQ